MLLILNPKLVPEYTYSKIKPVDVKIDKRSSGPGKDLNCEN